MPSDRSQLLTLPLAQRTRALMARYGLRPIKSLGQNFLVDENLAAKLTAAALESRPRTVIEIGAGLGALTVPLAQSGVGVEAWEKDPKLAAALQELCGGFDNVTLHIEDFLSADVGPWLGPETTVVGNLPYYITTPLLVRLLEAQPPFSALVITVQREFGQRLMARPGTPGCGALSVYCAYYVESVALLGRLSPKVFFPPPSVDSVALRLTPRIQPRPEVRSPTRLFAVVRAAFGYRRKTLLRALVTAHELGLSPEDAAAVLSAAGLDKGRRGETLSFEEFAALSNALAGWEASPCRGR